MEPKLTRVQPANDPTLRIDKLLLGLSEEAVHWAERLVYRKVGIPLQGLWDGPDGVRSVLEEKIQKLQIDEPLSPGMLARRVGFIQSKPKRIRKAG
jgi:hypothetical protein